MNPSFTLLKFVKNNLEALMWITALGYLLFINPYEMQHFSLCLFNNIGIDFCPGCGLGRSISMIYHGDIYGSFFMHPLGLFALGVIIYRIISLLKKSEITLLRG